MTPGALKLVADFEAAAASAQEAEGRLRKTMAEEIARLERERAYAFRRTRLIRLLASPGLEGDDEAHLAAQNRMLCEEFGWSSETPSHKEILDRLSPVAHAVRQCACASDQQLSSDATSDALRSFEQWFEATRGSSFYVLFERYVPETPVVDF